MFVSKPIGRWLIGFSFGTLLVGITSPLFVRSYVGRVVDPVRQVVTYPAEAKYRWRSEGYATTVIGPHGMPGQIQMADDSTTLRMGLYGDSQVEGVALPDNEKLFAMLQDRLPGAVVYPFARSGENASQWLPQMRRVEVGLGVGVHVIVIVDVEDLIAADTLVDAADQVESKLPNAVAGVPDFIVHAASRVLRDPVTGGPRQWRFRVGPVDRPRMPGRVGFKTENGTYDTDWITHLKAATERPLWIVFAPRVPEISDGRVKVETSDEALRTELQDALTVAGVNWIDVGDEFCAAALNGDWPHGFQNGQVGVGHLNKTGNAILADQIAALVGKGE